MPIYDFRCDECDNKFEYTVSSTVYHTPCTKCNGKAKRLPSCPRIALDGTDPAFPTAWDQWDKKRKQKMAQEAKQQEDTHVNT